MVNTIKLSLNGIFDRKILLKIRKITNLKHS